MRLEALFSLQYLPVWITTFDIDSSVVAAADGREEKEGLSGDLSIVSTAAASEAMSHNLANY